MPITSEKNLYPGINAHLNSILQNEPGGWQSFHSSHLVHLSEVLENLLPAHYYTRAEKSLQIGEVDVYQQKRKNHPTTPDVTIFQTGQGNSVSSTSAAALPVDTIEVSETLIEERDLMSVVIYEVKDGKLPGKAITRIELLSPDNLPLGARRQQYLLKRQHTLKSGLNLVEMDYLHESHPVLKNLPEYPHNENAYAYTILVSDVRRGIKHGKTYIYGWHVDEPIPAINIPLSGEDRVTMDFNAAYQQSFARSRFYQLVVDYATDPVKLNKYSLNDRKRLDNLLQSIRTEHG